MILEPGFFDHWKTRLLVTRTGSAAAPIAVLRLWEHAQLKRQHRLALTPRSLAGICRWDGSPQELWDAMTDPEAGWLDPTTQPGEWELHDFAKHNARLVNSWNCGNEPQKNQAQSGTETQAALNTRTGDATTPNTRPASAPQAAPRTDYTSAETANTRTDSTPKPPDVDADRKALERKGDRLSRERESAHARSDGPRSDLAMIEAIVRAYPKREAIHESMPAIASAIDAGEDPEAILASVRAIAAAIHRFPGGPLNRHVPSALRFFAGRRWHDDPAVWLARAEANHPRTRAQNDTTNHTDRW